MDDVKMPKMGFEGQAAQQQAGLGDFLWEAHAAGMKALEFTAGRDLNDYREHDVLRAAVESMLQLVATSLADVKDHFPEQFARIDHAEAAIALGGRLGQGANEAVWGFVRKSLTPLVAEVAEVLEDWHSA